MAGQLWSVNTLGGYFYSLNLSKPTLAVLERLD